MVEAARADPTLLVVDEFTGINGVGGGAGLLRTRLQHHVDEIAVVFAGSEPSAMTVMFTDQTRPFYAQADIIEIEPLTLAELDEIIRLGFTNPGQQPGGLAGLVHHATGRPLFGGTLELFGVSSRVVQAARNQLIANGTLTRQPTIVDPLLADWVRATLPL